MSPTALTYPASLHLHTLNMIAGRPLSDATSDPSWHVVDHAEVIGHGQEDFLAASYRLHSWRAHAHARVGVEEKGRRGTDGEEVLLHFGPTRSPCRILYREQTDVRTVMVYGTLPGHVECGEEAFVIELAADGTVTGRCVAFSRHAWWLARLGAPVARWVQKHETRLYVDGMRPLGQHARRRTGGNVCAG